MDLSRLDHEVERRSSSWSNNGFTWQLRHWPNLSKPSTSLRLSRAGAEGDLVLWASGEAELGWMVGAHPGVENDQEHYEISDLDGLRACLDDLEERLGQSP